MEKETKKEFSNLARMIKKGFDGVDKRFDGVDRKFAVVDKRFDRVEGRLDVLEKGQEDIRLRLDNVAYSFELRGLENRMIKVERKLGFKK